MRKVRVQQALAASAVIAALAAMVYLTWHGGGSAVLPDESLPEIGRPSAAAPAGAGASGGNQADQYSFDFPPPPPDPQAQPRRDPSHPTPVNVPLAVLRLPRDVSSPSPVYVPIATMPAGEDAGDTQGPELLQREEADRQAAAAAAALGSGPSHIMAMAADGRGNLWVGSEMQGVYRYTPATRWPLSCPIHRKLARAKE